MENIVPKCINNNMCLSVCNITSCKYIPFMCGLAQCVCQSLHEQCKTSTKWKRIKQLFSTKLKNSSSRFDAYFAQVNDLYKDILNQLENSYAKFKNITETFGLSQFEREVYEKLKQGKFTELTGQSIYKIEADLEKKLRQIRIIEKQKYEIGRTTVILIKMLENISKQSQVSFQLDSKITQDIVTISSFFPDKAIISMKLLYRASENAFQVSIFWDKCDRKSNTITILKTEFDKIIGGYTPLPWSKIQNNQYSTDKNRQCFLFSLNNKQKLELVKGRQQFSIFNYTAYGPIFGAGKDLVISNKANQNSNSYAYPGHSYNYYNEYIYADQSSVEKLSGQSSGYYFKVLQWQVYEIVFK